MDEASARNAPRRRSLDAKEEAHWLTDELEAVGELKRGAIAAQFPEEFNVDSDFLNGTNVWLPARLHPEIAPGEFQEWLKKHGSQLSKMEDSVNRRKSILSYSVSPEPRQSSGRSVRRRNTTQLVRRKTFVERAAEEEEKDAPFLVQSTKSSLKRSKLANKRRDSTASSTGRRRRREASPLVPGNSTDEDAPASRAPPAAVDGARLSTAEILKQVTAAVDDLGFDELGAGDLDGYDAHALAAPPAGQQQQQQQQQPATPSTQAPQQGKTVTHKKSASWWQWGGRDDSNGAEEKEPHPPMPQTPNSAAAQPAPDSSLKAKLPSPISFLRFNRRSKKDRRSTDEPGAVQPAASSAPPAPLGLGPKKQPSASASASAAAPAPPAPAVQAQTEESDGASDGEGATQKPSIPSIITPVRPPPTRLAAGNSRLPIHIERAIYRLASIKLANPRRPLLQQVLLSNMMFWYLELINPRSQQQPQQQQQQQQPPPQQQPQQQHQHQQPQHQQMQPQQPPVQQQQQHQQHQQHQQQQQQHPQQHPQQQMHQHMQHRSPSPDPLGSVDKRGKRGHKAREQGNRRRSSGGGERVMRSPQYERQQQQIYMGAQQQQPYPNNVYYQQPVPPSSNSDEDDDVPLALYRGERNAMSIG